MVKVKPVAASPRLLPAPSAPDELLALLKTASISNQVLMHKLICTTGGLGSHCFHARQDAMVVQQLLTFARQGKTAEPLSKYDPDLTLALNSRGFFSSAIGYYFERQRSGVLGAAIKGDPATMLFTSEYGLQNKSAPRARLWTVDYTLCAQTLWVSSVFGSVNIFPSLLYDIAGVEAMSAWYANELQVSKIVYTWFFHQLIGNGTDSLYCYPSDVVLRTVPDLSEVAELLRLEIIARTEPSLHPPIPRIPLSTELARVNELLHLKWRPTNGT